MSLERRLQEGFERLAGEPDPSVDAQLERVIRRGRRQRSLGRAGLGLGVAASLIIAVAVGGRLLDAFEDSSVRPVEEPAPPLSAVAGSYAATLPSGGQAVIVRNDMGGTWTFTLGDDGTILVDAPAPFGDVPSGYSYELTTDAGFTTNLFVNDVCGDRGVGTYRWLRSGERLTFAVVDDPCAIRRALLTTVPWTTG